jgi:hypothetical protein
MPGVDHDADADGPTSRSWWVTVAALAALALLILTRGVVTMLVGVFGLVLIGLAVGGVVALARVLRGSPV